MATVTAFEAKARFGELLDRVGRGEEIIITRHAQPVARIVPVGSRSLEQVGRAVSALSQLRQQIGQRVKGNEELSDSEVRSAVEEGRL
jgi:prevent-host-death family protein